MKRFDGIRARKGSSRKRNRNRISALTFETLEKRFVLAAPTINVSVIDGDASEPANSGSFEFSRSGGDGSEVTVQYSVTGSAQNGNDYSTLSGQVTIPAGTDFFELPYEELNFGIQPVYFHDADFNHDGKLDLAVASHQAVPGTLSIHLGDGTGDFAAPLYYRTAGIGPRSLEVADLNEDGEFDIAVANHNTNEIAVFLGRGDGTFDDAMLTPRVDINPRMIKAADFNSDGHLDLVTANYGGTNVTLLLGDGTGTFGQRTDFTTSPSGDSSAPRSMVVEDFNEDGKPDVAVSSSHGANVSILLGVGNGTFSPLRTVSWGPDNEYSLNITSDDLNHDGHMDLVTANYFGSSLSVLLGDGAANFSGPQHFDLGHEQFEPRTVTTGDFNLDGHPDLAVADGKEVRVGILLGDGAGNFGPKQEYFLLPPRTLPILWNASVLARDFDLDGRTDIVAVRDLSSFVVLQNRTEPGGVAVSTATVTIDVLDDTESEPAESVVLTVIDDAAYDPGSSSSATIQIQDNDSDPQPTGGLLARWMLDETSGTVAADATGNNYHATLVGDPIWTTGKLAGGLQFEGTNDFADAGQGPSIVGTGDFAVAAWLRTTSTSDQVIIQQRSPREYNGQYQMHVKSSGEISFWTFGGSAYGPTVSSTQTVNDGEWHHVIGVRENDGTMRIYIDGILDGTAAGSSRPLAPINVYVGVDRRSNSRYFNGTLDDVRIYDRALDSQEATALANSLFGPLAIDDQYAVTEDVSLNVSAPGLLQNDIGENLSVTSINVTSELGVSISGGTDGSCQYNSAGAFNHLSVGATSTDVFTYTISDGSVMDTATATITISGVNDPPTASDDTAPATEDAALSIDVLANDADVDTLDMLTIVSIDDTTTVGSVSLNADDTILYDPNGQFEYLAVGQSATATFGYTISDGNGATANASVSVTISGANDQPVADDDSASTNERRAVTIDVLEGDSDPDLADVLTVTSLHDASTIGIVTIAADGTIRYDPAGQFDALDDGQTATDTFGYQLSDGNGGVASATVAVTIIGRDASSEPTEGLLAQWSLDDGAGTVAADESGNGYDGVVGGDPVWSDGYLDGAIDLDGFGDHINAGLGPSIVGTAGFTVAAWVRSSASAYQVLIQQRSPQEYNGEYMLQLTPTGHARFWTFGGTGYGPFAVSSQTVNDGQWHHVVGVREDDGTTKIYVDGVIDASEAGAPRPLVPIAVYLGADMRGASNFLNGSLDDVRIYDRALDPQEVETLYSYVPSVDPEIAVNDSYSTDEETILSLAAPGLLANDIGTGLTITAIDSDSALGASVSGGTDGAFQYDPSSSLGYLAEAATAVDSFTYTVSDGTTSDIGTVTINVAGVNDEPIAENDMASTDEDDAILIDVRTNDFDVDATDELIVAALDDSSAIGQVSLNPDGTVWYDPAGNFNSLATGESTSDSFGYTIDDEHGGSDTADVDVTIHGTNDAPMASADLVTTNETTGIVISVLNNDSDVDTTDTLSVTSVEATGTLGLVTLNSDNTIAYDPAGQFDSLAAGETATDVFSYAIADPYGGIDSATVTITIQGVDESSVPTDGLLAHWSLDDDGGVIATDQSGNDFDAAINGDPVWSVGNVAGALDFDGFGDHLNAGTGPSIVGTDGFTVAAWVRSSSGTNQVIIQQRSPQDYNGEYQLHVQASGHARFWTFGGFNYGPIVASSQTINDGQWHHVVGVREDDGTTKVYIDGSLDGNKSGVPRPLVPIAVYLGADMRGGSKFLNGSLDEVLIYDRALSGQEVLDLANLSTQSGGSGDSLVLINRSAAVIAAISQSHSSGPISFEKGSEMMDLRSKIQVLPCRLSDFRPAPQFDWATLDSSQKAVAARVRSGDAVDAALGDSRFISTLADQPDPIARLDDR